MKDKLYRKAAEHKFNDALFGACYHIMQCSDEIDSYSHPDVKFFNSLFDDGFDRAWYFGHEDDSDEHRVMALLLAQEIVDSGGL